MYGAGANQADITHLSATLQQFMNENIASLKDVRDQLSETRLKVLQHKICLDYLLSSQGGVCALIGQECCLYITDRDYNVSHHLQQMQTLTSSLTSLHAETGGIASL